MSSRRLMVAGAVLAVGATAAWFGLAAPAGANATQRATEFDKSLVELDDRVARSAGKELVARATDAVRDRSLICSAFELERLGLAAPILTDPLPRLSFDSTPISEWRRVIAVLRQDGSRLATVALKSAGGPDVPGWPLFTPSWFESSAPDPEMATLKDDLATLRLDLRFADAVASSGGLALHPSVLVWTADVPGKWRTVTATLVVAIPTRSVPQLVSKLMTTITAVGARAELTGVALSPPDSLRSGFGVDPPVDVTVKLTAMFPVAAEGVR